MGIYKDMFSGFYNEEFKDSYVEGYHEWKKSLKEELKDSNNDNNDECSHANKYKNIVSSSLKFWSCKDCGADLGDIL